MDLDEIPPPLEDNLQLILNKPSHKSVFKTNTNIEYYHLQERSQPGNLLLLKFTKNKYKEHLNVYQDYNSFKLPIDVTLKNSSYRLAGFVEDYNGKNSRFYKAYSYVPINNELPWKKVPSDTVGKKADYLEEYFDDINVPLAIYFQESLFLSTHQSL